MSLGNFRYIPSFESFSPEAGMVDEEFEEVVELFHIESGKIKKLIEHKLVVTFAVGEVSTRRSRKSVDVHCREKHLFAVDAGGECTELRSDQNTVSAHIEIDLGDHIILRELKAA